MAEQFDELIAVLVVLLQAKPDARLDLLAVSAIVSIVQD